ncbi:hypothetical protein AOLI_G00179660 [Acnodon oligacanthus]
MSYPARCFAFHKEAHTVDEVNPTKCDDKLTGRRNLSSPLLFPPGRVSRALCARAFEMAVRSPSRRAE